MSWAIKMKQKGLKINTLTTTMEMTERNGEDDEGPSPKNKRDDEETREGA